MLTKSKNSIVCKKMLSTAQLATKYRHILHGATMDPPKPINFWFVVVFIEQTAVMGAPS
jgi:hypothetical protein